MSDQPTELETTPAQRWFRLAEQDLAAAGVLLRDGSAALRIEGFLARQAAEKALESGLLALGASAPRIHDLRQLNTLYPSTRGMRFAVIGSRRPSFRPSPRLLGGWRSSGVLQAIGLGFIGRFRLESGGPFRAPTSSDVVRWAVHLRCSVPTLRTRARARRTGDCPEVSPRP